MLTLGSVSGEQVPPAEKVPRTTDLEVGGFPKARPGRRGQAPHSCSAGPRPSLQRRWVTVPGDPRTPRGRKGEPLGEAEPASAWKPCPRGPRLQADGMLGS